MPYTLVDHTADIGMRVSAPTVEELFVEAAHALCDIMGGLTDHGEDAVTVRAAGIDHDELLVRWLHEVLFLVEVKGFRVSGITLQDLTDTGVTGMLAGSFSGAPLLAEVKAVTYHTLEIARIDNACVATIILDM